MANSASNIFSSPISVPACDSWGYIRAEGSGSVSLIDGSGISSVARKSAGLYGVSFSSPASFGGGAYVVLMTPETEGYQTVITATDGWLTSVANGGATATGRTHGVEIGTWDISSPQQTSPGGYTASLKDIPGLRVNFAAFALKTNTDTYSEQVVNYLKSSEDFLGSDWGKTPAQGSQTTNIVQLSEQYRVQERTPNELSKIFVMTGDAAGSGTNYISQAADVGNRTMTFSAFAKAGTGVTLWLYIGGNGNNFSGRYNLENRTATTAGSVTSPGFATAAISDVGDGWKRCSLTFNTPLSPTMLILPGHANGMNGNTVIVSGAQLEEGSVATEYIKTTDTQVLGDQDIRKRLVPGASGFGVTGATYNSHLPNLLSKRSAVAYGTIVACPAASNATNPIVSLEGSYNIKTVTAQSNAEYIVEFLNPLKDSNYCVIVCGEQEPINSNPDWSEVGEYPLFHVLRGTNSSRKSANQFSIVKLHQNSADNSWGRRSERYQRGFRDRIHFMVFGGGTYGQP
jgi:hypothetical protein